MISAGRRRVGYLATALLLVGAGAACFVIWNQYLTAPWTRDGQVQAYVVDLAPEVSGRIVHLDVVDNQSIKMGDPLYEIEPVDYEISVAAAQANMESKEADLQAKEAEAARRARLSDLSTSVEETQTYQAAAYMARAAYATAITQLNQAKIDLARTKVASPVNGYVTNLQLRVGDFAVKGTHDLSLVDTDSFWITGFFEETKLAGIHVGDPAVAALMSSRAPVEGHVESVARGINTPNSSPGALGLASVDAVFTWVRLAQRIPVRIHIDRVPPSVELAIGLTATVSIGKDVKRGSSRGLLSRLFTQVEN